MICLRVMHADEGVVTRKWILWKVSVQGKQFFVWINRRETHRELYPCIYTCFIDYEKAFDNVLQRKLFKYPWDVRYRQNVSQYPTKSELGTNGKGWHRKCWHTKGVRQGCVLWPLLFNLYVEHIMSSTLSPVKLNSRTRERSFDQTYLLLLFCIPNNAFIHIRRSNFAATIYTFSHIMSKFCIKPTPFLLFNVIS